MTVTVYKSTDSSAPTLTGEVGSVINVLDKCLVAGYGAKTAAGWTKPYTGTGLAVFRQGGGNQFYLDVADNAYGGGGYKEAFARGYEVMTAVGAGTSAFPVSADLIIRKSNTADNAARVWMVIADDRTFYLLTKPEDTGGAWSVLHFGDFYSLLAGDGYRTLIHGRYTANNGALSYDAIFYCNYSNYNWQPVSGLHMARSYTGSGGSMIPSKQGDSYASSSTGNALVNGQIAFPNPTDGGYYISRIPLVEYASAVKRGWLRGLWHFGHAAAYVVDGDTFTGSGDLAGRTFLVVKQTSGGAAIIIETSSTWDTTS